MASARIQRWAPTLSAFDYTISYKPGKDQASADLLSRLPLGGFPKETPTPADTILLMECLETSPTSFNHIKLWTSAIIVTTPACHVHNAQPLLRSTNISTWVCELHLYNFSQHTTLHMHNLHGLLCRSKHMHIFQVTIYT